jgi:hypothetical protein
LTYSLDDEALPLAAASQLRLDRQDDGIEIGPLALSLLQCSGYLRPAQPDFDPIGRDGSPTADRARRVGLE